MINKETTRPCPVCGQGTVRIEELNRGSRCTYCHKLIESDFVFSAGIPLLIAILIGLAFNSGYPLVGFVGTGLMVGYSITFDPLVTRYIPMKHYGDSD